jgi:Tol biopolymer transport system component
MKKVSAIIIVAWFFLGSINLAAQPSPSGDPLLLIPADGTAWLNPVWSPNGQYIAFSSGKYVGLWIANADGSNIRQLSAEEGAGFGFSWSADSKTILVRPSVFRNMRRFQSVELINVENAETKVLVEPSRGIRSVPQWAHRDQHVAVVMNEELQLVESGKAPLGHPVVLPETPVLFTIDGKLFRSIAGQKDPTALADFGDQTIFNVQFSPDGDKIAFQVAARGLFVMNLDGSGLKNLGWAERPCWTPDGKYLVAMLTSDDGHRITSGDLYAIDIVSGAAHLLTGQTSMVALSPSVSHDGRRIAFENPEDGGIYVLEIKQGF